MNNIILIKGVKGRGSSVLNDRTQLASPLSISSYPAPPPIHSRTSCLLTFYERDNVTNVISNELNEKVIELTEQKMYGIKEIEKLSKDNWIHLSDKFLDAGYEISYIEKSKLQSMYFEVLKKNELSMGIDDFKFVGWEWSGFTGDSKSLLKHINKHKLFRKQGWNVVFNDVVHFKKNQKKIDVLWSRVADFSCKEEFWEKGLTKSSGKE